MISLELCVPEMDIKSEGEIRLIERSFNSDERFIGCYCFPIKNIVAAHQQLQTNILKLSVEITSHYRL